MASHRDGPWSELRQTTGGLAADFACGQSVTPDRGMAGGDVVAVTSGH
jgi:hypothetical protein